MANYGIGIGSFLDGVGKGVEAGMRYDTLKYNRERLDRLDRRQEAQDAIENDFRSKQLDLSTNADKRAAQAHEINQKVILEGLGESQAKRQRDADVLGIYRDAGAEARSSYDPKLEKSIMRDSAPYGPNRDGFRVGNEGPTFPTSQDAMGEAKSQLTFGEHYAKTAGKQIQEAFLAKGYLKEAEGFGKFIESETAKNNLNRIGEAANRAKLGDYDGALRHLKPVLNDEGYNPDGKQYGFEVVRDSAGNPVGIEGWGKDTKTGKVERQRFDSAESLFKAVVPLVNPADAYMKLAAKDDKPADFQVIGENDQGKQYGFVDKERRTVTHVDAGASAAERNPYAPGKFTETQGKAATYGDRMAASHGIIGELENINSGFGGFVGGTVQNNMPAGVANVLSGPDRQRFEQAKRDFVNAVLRRESGAAISESEFDSANRQYFPQPGDSQQVIAQKRANRVNSIQGLMREAGPSYRPPQGWNGPQAQQQAPQPPQRQPQPQQVQQPQPTAAQVAPQRRSVPAGAIELLRSNPSLAQHFDQKYGAGSAAGILGGQ